MGWLHDCGIWLTSVVVNLWPWRSLNYCFKGGYKIRSVTWVTQFKTVTTYAHDGHSIMVVNRGLPGMTLMPKESMKLGPQMQKNLSLFLIHVQSALYYSSLSLSVAHLKDWDYSFKNFGPNWFETLGSLAVTNLNVWLIYSTIYSTKPEVNCIAEKLRLTSKWEKGPFFPLANMIGKKNSFHWIFRKQDFL